jgi:negative regulator of sigma E activity
MNDNQPLNEDILLDRLVDGELTGNERHQLLESFDKRPEGWRRCALAFLEAQSWREEMGQVARGVVSETNAPKSPAPSVAPSRKPSWSSIATWLAMAASLLLAFGLGMVHREHGQSVAGTSANPTGQIAKVTPSGKALSPKSGTPSDAVTFFVKDDGGRMQPVRVPLVDANTLDRELGMTFQTGVPDDVRNQLKDNGYAVKSKRQYAPLWLENGRPMILPVEDTNIVPVSNVSNKVY